MNRESLTQLKSAKQIASRPAYLQISGQDKGFYAFNYNPESFTDSLSAKYSEVSALSSRVPYQDYQNGSGITRKFSGLIMDTYSEGLSLRVILDGLKELMFAHVDKGEFEPVDVEFHWGSESFKPCKLVDMSYTQDLWLGGEFAHGTLDLTLLQVPNSDPAKIPTVAAVTQAATVSAIVSNPSLISVLPVALTDRQKGEGVVLAIADLKANLTKISSSASNAIRSGKYSVILDTLGQAKLLDGKGKELLNSGIYNGIKFVSTLINKN